MKRSFDTILTEFINKNEWVIPLWFIVSVLIIGLIDKPLL